MVPLFATGLLTASIVVSPSANRNVSVVIRSSLAVSSTELAMMSSRT
ncbi:hypothetical protein [Haloquadratum walsbyi]|nr:hypothetical protein [Haloquadratum walsbyi]